MIRSFAQLYEKHADSINTEIEKLNDLNLLMQLAEGYADEAINHGLYAPATYEARDLVRTALRAELASQQEVAEGGEPKLNWRKLAGWWEAEPKEWDDLKTIVIEMFAASRAPVAAGSVPAGGEVPKGFALVPLRLTREMDDVIADEGWQWEDLLAAAGSITAEQYDEIAAQPVAQDANDARRYLWLLPRLSGRAYREAGIIYSDGIDSISDAIDAAIQASEKGGAA